MTEQTLFGKPVSRVDGPLKVTGGATYAYEYATGTAPLYGYVVGATIARGSVARIDAKIARQAADVRLVMTHLNAPRQTSFGAGDATGAEARNRFTFARPCLADDHVRFFGEPVALVVADTFEQARGAAELLDIRYAKETGDFSLDAGVATAYRPDMIVGGRETDTAFGDLGTAMVSAPVTLEAIYRTPYQKHNAMEPHAAIATWQGDALTLYTSTQTVPFVRTAVAKTLGLRQDQVRIVSSYVGGGFGGKIAVQPETILAALASRELRQPVKVAQTRQQLFATVGHRPEMVHKMRLAASHDGTLQGYGHEVWMQAARHEEFAEQVCAPGRSLYAAPNRLSRHRLVPLDVTAGDTMRAPGEASGLLAVESAMDELAHRLGMDPVELRLKNEPVQDPERGVPFSSRNLVACLQEGARRFGWDQRPATPGSRREGRMLVGYGMAAAIRPNLLQKGSASVTLGADGRLTARLAMTDIGTGSYTILSQVAADALGMDLADVTVLLGDSDYPENFGSGGSVGAASSAVALRAACMELRERLVALAVSHRNAPFPNATGKPEAEFAAGRIRIDDESETLASLVGRIAPASVGLGFTGCSPVVTSSP